MNSIEWAKRFKSHLILILMLLLTWVASISAADIYVSPAGGGSGTPASPTDFQSALDTARTNGEDDTIYLQQGFYDASTAGANTYVYDTTNNDNMKVMVSGGWNTDFTVQTTDPSLTQLDGGSNARIFEILSNAPGIAIEFEIEYLTFQNGSTVGHPGPSPYFNGAGILAYSGVAGDGTLTLTVQHCRFLANDADDTSGSGHYGGGIFSACDLEVDDCYFADNLALRGGGIRLTTANGSPATAPLVQNSVFEDNRGTWDGGGIGAVNVNPTIVNCQFSATLMDGSGASYYHHSGGTSTISRCHFVDNHSYYYGGAMHFWDSSAQISDTIFLDNTCGNFSGNGYGGAIATYDPSSATPQTVTVTNCTFANNTSNPGSGGGDAIYNRVQHLILTNCIFWDNDGGHGVQLSTGGTGTASYCDFQGGVPSGVTNGGNNINLDPAFVDLAMGDLDLGSSSPCIDMGDNAAPGIGTLDVEGRTRIVDGDGDAQADVDMGAYEYHSPLWPLLDTWHTAPEFNDVCDFVDFLNAQ